MPINNISQIISTIPEAGRRGIDVQTVFVNKQEDFQDHLQGTTVTELNTLKTQMNTMAGQMNTTATQVNTNANTASTKASQASASATSASASASTATTKASQASTSASTATTKANEASVSATSASASASTATTKASEASASATTATTQAGIATTKASEASASATSASQSLDSINGILATLPDGTINDTLIGTDKAFSNQALVGAVGNIMSPLLDLPLKNSLTMKAGVGSTTFTRASTATYIDRYGVLKTAGIDEPRFEKDGLLIEGSSTNLLTYSQNISSSNFTFFNSTVNSTTEVFLDGTSTATSFTSINDNSGCYTVTTAPTASVSYTLSCFYKISSGLRPKLYLRDHASSANGAFASFNIDTLSVYDISTSGTYSNASGKIEAINSEWVRVSLTTTIGTNLSLRAHAISPSTTVNTHVIGGMQLEALPFATSYIPTTDSAVTRASDYCSCDNQYNTVNTKMSSISLCATYKPLGETNDDAWRSILSSTANRDSMLAHVNSVGGGSFRNKFGFNSRVILNGIDTIKYNLVATYESDGGAGVSKGYLDGVQKAIYSEITSSEYNATNKVVIGADRDPINCIYGHISEVKIYDYALTPTEVALLGGK